MLRGLRTRASRALLVPAAVLALGLAACGQDDGASVRPVGDAGGGGSASAADGEHAEDEHAEDEHAAGGSGAAHDHGEARHADCTTAGTVQAEGTHIDVGLHEWMITLDTEQVTAGPVGMHVENTGAEEHELVIVRGSLGDLPTDQAGALLEEELEQDAMVGEVEGIPAGEACDATFDLEPGTYVFLCNIVEEEDGTTESHLEEGMATVVTVSA